MPQLASCLWFIFVENQNKSTLYKVLNSFWFDILGLEFARPGFKPAFITDPAVWCWAATCYLWDSVYSLCKRWWGLFKNWDNTCECFIPRSWKFTWLMKNYCHDQLIYLQPFYSVMNQKDYFHLGRDDKKKKNCGIYHHPCKVRTP